MNASACGFRGNSVKRFSSEVIDIVEFKTLSCDSYQYVTPNKKTIKLTAGSIPSNKINSKKTIKNEQIRYDSYQEIRLTLYW